MNLLITFIYQGNNVSTIPGSSVNIYSLIINRPSITGLITFIISADNNISINTRLSITIRPLINTRFLANTRSLIINRPSTTSLIIFIIFANNNISTAFNSSANAYPSTISNSSANTRPSINARPLINTRPSVNIRPLVNIRPSITFVISAEVLNNSNTSLFNNFEIFEG